MASRDSHSKSSDEYWTYLEDNLREVSTWPKWMRGERSEQKVEDEDQSQEASKEDDKDEEAAA